MNKQEWQQNKAERQAQKLKRKDERKEISEKHREQKHQLKLQKIVAKQENGFYSPEAIEALTKPLVTAVETTGKIVEGILRKVLSR